MKNSVSLKEKLATLSEDRASLLHLLLNQRNAGSRSIGSHARTEDGRVPASWAQRRLWFIDQLEGGGAAYNIPICITFKGRLNAAALLAALDALIDRHEVLRTTFVSVDGELFQRIAPLSRFALSRVDLGSCDEQERRASILRHTNEEAALPFDLGHGPLIRGRLLSLQPDEHLLLITMHHIVSDGWSLAVLSKEIGELYSANVEGRDSRLPKLSIQYADYAQWQKEWFQGLVRDRQIGYWRNRLTGAPPHIELPLDHPRPAEQSYRGAVLDVTLDAELSAKLKALAQQHDMTLFMVLSAGWALLLSRLGGQDDVVFGTPVANRRRPELEELIGFFVNTLALRVQVTDDMRLRELLQQTKQTLLAAYDHQDMPFERLVEELRPERTLNRHPLFQVMFSLQNAPKAELQLPGLHARVEEGANHAAKFDLLLWLEERDDRIVGSIKYAIDLFERDTVARWMASFKTILEEMTRAEAGAPVGELEIMPDAERRCVIETFNATRTPYPHHKLMHELFEEQVRRQPDVTALVSGDLTLTFAELDRRANRLARHLRRHGVGPDRLVGICVARSLDLMIGVLGILKAGGAYVPLDPDYPSERLRNIIDDANPGVVLTQADLRQRLPAVSARMIALDADWPAIEQESDEAIDPRAIGLTSRNLAYVIYTSGSTGQPKGVMIEHHNVLSLWQGLEDIYAQAPGCQRIGVNASFNFDASVKQIVQLLSGRSIALVPTEARLDAHRLLEFIDRHEIDGIDCTPSQLKAWIGAGLLERGAGHCLRLVLIGGEPIDRELWNTLAGQQRIEFFNVYGPTESTVDTTFCRLRGDVTSPHIGRPMQNRHVYILDRHHQPVPIGVPGEIYIGGEGVARGYLRRPELTQERFLPDPFAADAQARMYKTGDLGRWRADGTIEYLGRNDDQVKIRGFRIELGEIEAQLTLHESVREAAVVAREDAPGEKRLVAYVTRSGEDVSIEGLRTYLKGTLPEYMTPSAFVVLESLPLTPSGKLNRRALPAPERDAYAMREYEAPQGEVEEILAGIWQSLLRVERVGRQDNFFELGGHSLLIVQMLERLRRVGLTADVRGVFESASLMDLAQVLRKGAGEAFVAPPNLIPADCTEITPEMLPLVALEREQIERIVANVPGGVANIQDIYPLAPLQEGILFHYLLNEQGGDAYVLPTILRVSSRERLDALIQALQSVIDRHDVLRTAVLWEQLPQPVQVVYRRATLPVDEVTLAADRDVTEQVQEWSEAGRQRMDLRHAPLMRLQVAADPHSDQWYVLMQRHHVTSDHVTLEAVTAEVVAVLTGKARELQPSAPYRNHVAQALAYAKTNAAEQFFSAKLSDVDEPTAPFGLVDVHADGVQREEAREELDAELAQRVRTQARRLGVSAATLFHAAYGLVIAKTSGRDDIVFGSVLLGRMQGADVRRVLGLFINTLPLRLRLKGLTTKALVEQTQRELIELLVHEQASLAIAQRCSGIESSAPLFSALLNYRHSASNPEAEWSSAPGIAMVSGHARTNYPISMAVDDKGTGFALKAQTDCRIDPQRLLGYLQTSVRSLVDDLERDQHADALSLSVLPEAERRQVVETFNATDVEYAKDLLIPELFEAQAAQIPDVIAVASEAGSLTYRELNERANQLAWRLREQDVGPDGLVAIYLERSLEMVIGLLAVLKAGGAYVPLDPVHPAERLNEMLQDCRPVAVLTQRTLQSRVSAPADCVVLALDEQPWHEGPWNRYPSENPRAWDTGLQSHHLAYVIYTSGSTGKPKGVMVEHRNVLYFIQGLERRIHAVAPDCRRIAWNSSFGFDMAVKAWGQLLFGRTVHLVPEEVRLSGERLVEWLERHDIEAMECTPSHLAMMLRAGFMQGRAAALRKLLLGGEAIDVKTWSRLAASSQVTFYNMYGPTECSVDASCGPIDGTTPNVGLVMPQARIYILDERRQPTPLGITGEIYIGGVGVARGYLNRPELTTERFLRDPFSSNGDDRMYRTGDLGRLRADGAIEYMGRNDHQVKIRGYRIELGEIEAHLLAYPGIGEAAVLVREDSPGDKRLVAYVAAKESGSVQLEALRTQLKASLPEYMVPAAFVTIDKLPLNANGKLDRRALPAPQGDAFIHQEYEPPQTDMEDILAGIWQSLLRVERVGRRDNFFALGGHSLLIVQMMERLRGLGLAVGLRSIFDSATLADLAIEMTPTSLEQSSVPPNRIPADSAEITPDMLPLVALEPEHIQSIADCVPGGAANIQDIYPLAPLQEGILFHYLMNQQGGDTYVIPTLLAVSSRQRVDQLIEALQSVIDRHDTLRTAVLWEHLPRPVQVVYRHATLPVEELQFDPQQDALEQARAWMRRDLQKMNPRTAPLLRLRIAQDPHSETCYVLLQAHHIVDDAVSRRLVTAEVVSLLSGQVQAPVTLTSYRNHVAQLLATSAAQSTESFFRSKLSDVDAPTAPFGLLDVHGDGSRIAEVRQVLDAELASSIRAQARRLGVSAATLFHAAWAMVVAGASGRDDVVFGSVLLGRLGGSVGARQVLGLFINTLPLRLQLSDATAAGLVHQTQRELVELLHHEQTSLAVAQRCSGIFGSAPLFTALLNYRHAGGKVGLTWADADGIQVIERLNGTNYPITLSVDDLGEGFALVAQTDNRIDPASIAQYLSTALNSLTSALEKAPQTPVLALPFLPEQERQRVIETFNDTRTEPRVARTVHELFEEQAARWPSAVAAIHDARAITYADLNARANRLAKHLRTLGVADGELVGICVERSLDMVVGLLGILKAGAAYVPLDPNYPPERLQYMLDDASPSVVVTQRSLRAQLVSTAPMVSIDEDWEDVEKYSSENPLATGSSDGGLVYVIYTSGSTGRPKGAAMPHRAMVNLIEWHRQIFGVHSERRVLQFAALSFDVAFQEIFSTLCTGGTLVLLDEWIRRDARALLDLLSKQRVERLFLPPLMLQSLAECDKGEPSVELHLRDVITAGEQLRVGPEVRSLFERLPDCRLHNHYGPTETHVVTALTLAGDPSQWPALPSIGRPIDNTQIYIVDRHYKPAPMGVPGEIYIGGEGVARGYLRRPELTQERFLRDPFAADPQARMYKTGDLGRWRADGTIEYLGRNDDQVKIRGFRIELGEIEAQLTLHESVREAAVVAREDSPGEKRLVAYVTRSGEDVSIEGLRTYLKATLPEYMTPSAFVVLESLPLTPSGKLNRRALPAPERDAYAMREYEAPQGEVEEILAGIWQSLLRVERVGRQDNFFELGGHSLLIVQMLERLRRVGLTADVRGVFESASLMDLAQVLRKGAGEAFVAPPNLIPAHCAEITPEMLPLVALEREQIARIVASVPGGVANIQDIYPLAPLQEGILFHYLLNEQGGDAYVLPTILRVSSRERLDALIQALQSVIDRHDVLRTAVLWEQLPQPVQVVYRRATLPVDEVALTADRDVTEQVQQWSEAGRQRMDLRHAPLMRLQVAADPHSDQWYVLMQIHHIVDDATSRKIAISEIIAHLSGHADRLPASTPYRNHVARTLVYAKTNAAEQFFSAKLSDVDETTAPFGIVDVHGENARHEMKGEFHAELGQRLRSQARRLGVSAATLFHAAWGLVVAQTSGRDDIVFGSVLLGRLQGAEMQRVLGLFINTLPVRLRLKDLTAKGLVERTQRELVALMSHEQASLALAQRCSGVGGSAPLFTSLLNYRHGARDADATWAGADGVDVIAARTASNYAVALSIDDMTEKFLVGAQTDARIDAGRLVGYLHAAVESLIGALERAPQTNALELSVLPEAEWRQVIESFNATQAQYPNDLLIHQLFEQQALKTPDATAVVCEEQSLTYSQLNTQANQLAKKLRELGVGPDRLVAVYLERNLSIIVGILAVLKAGGAYVPMDPHYPTERLLYMLRDSAPLVTLTQQSLGMNLPELGDRVLVLDAPELVHELASCDSSQIAEPGLKGCHLAYVIYTSGSTGAPKGVGVEHRNLVNVIHWHADAFKLGPANRCSSVAGLGFDAAVWEIWPTLSCGATLVLAPAHATADPEALLKWWRRQAVDISFLPTPMAELAFSRNIQPLQLRTLLVGGDRLRHRPTRATYALFNNYGPTEATILATSGYIRDDDALLHIGKPIANSRIYILNSRLQPVPLGAEGEVYIGGAGVARGYLYRPELTTQRFTPDPFHSEPGACMYRTGDVARWRADGTIEYIGRNDNQVKIRGYRIELGEIEARLIEHPLLKDAVVLAQGASGDEQQLVAYVVPQELGAAEVGAASLREHLKATLPEYMLPSAFVTLSSLPITANGKLDRKALPKPELTDFTGGEYEPVQGVTEELLAELWCNVLGLQQIGRHDNFFELGGHSLSGMRLITQVQQRFDVHLPVTMVFQSPTIFEMALTLESLSGRNVEPAEDFEEGIIADAAYNGSDDLMVEMEGAK